MKLLLAIPALALVVFAMGRPVAPVPVSVAAAPAGIEFPAANSPATAACDCALLTCATCALPGAGPVLGSPDETIVARHGDLVQLRIRVVFRAEDHEEHEGLYRVCREPLLVVTAVRLEHQQNSMSSIGLDAEPTPVDDARHAYLRTRRARIDPILALRRAPGVVDLRVFPVETWGQSVAIIEAWGLCGSRDAGARLYRTGERILAVESARDAADAGFVDHDSGRTLRFFAAADAPLRFKRLLAGARTVPCVPQLEEAIRGESAPTAWVAVERWRRG